jgi:hypothetical protein
MEDLGENILYAVHGTPSNILGVLKAIANGFTDFATVSIINIRAF